jgi:hypothetical protein
MSQNGMDRPCSRPTGSQSWCGAFEEHEERTTMPYKTDVVVAHTIGIQNNDHPVSKGPKGCVELYCGK